MSIDFEALAKPFEPGEVQFKVQAKLPDGRGLVVPYVDARAVIERLNEVAGTEWQDEYEVRGTGESFYAICKLTLGGITRQDVGEGDTPKGAVSDALKRAAVKFGVGLYLYKGKKLIVELDERGNPKPRQEELYRMWMGGGEAKQGDQPASTGAQGGATQKQINFAKALLRDKLGQDVDPEDFMAWYLKQVGNSKKDVSELIDILQGSKEGLQDLVNAYMESPPF